MTRESYPLDEVVLCTYPARFNAQDIGGIDAIRRLRGRSSDSIRAKILNIVAMLDEEGIPRESRFAGLSGRPRGGSGRRTNWDWVQPLTALPRGELLERSRAILARNHSPT